jgi:hypothetical protein
MIKDFNRFLRDKLDNQKHTYTHCEGEIYRHSNQITFDKAMSENNFIIVGEAFFHLDKETVDQYDMFFMNTVKFNSKAMAEHNLIMDYSEHIQTRKLFLAFLENVRLIEKHKRHPDKYTLETKSFYYSNVFYFRSDNSKPLALPYLTMQTPTGYIQLEFNHTQLQNVNEQIRIINETFREYYFKHVLDKTVTEMSDDEKKAVIMFYQ